MSFEVMWKDFFFYPKGDRIAILSLSTSIVVMLIIIWLIPKFQSDTLDKYAITKADSALQAFRQSVYEYQYAKDSMSHNNTTLHSKQRLEIVLESFDPNLIDSVGLLRLGVPSFVAKNILRYRSKGGVFRTPESLAKIYGFTDELYRVLNPYIYISEQFRPYQRDTIRLAVSSFAKRDSVTFKYSEGTVLDLNAVDTAELKKVPGIGSALSKQIIAHRNRLGGFYKVEQLQENGYLSIELNKWFVVNTLPFRRVNINKAGIEQLRNHPYLNFYQARVIIEHRRKRGKLKNLNQLSLYEEFSTADLERLKYYVEF